MIGAVPIAASVNDPWSGHGLEFLDALDEYVIQVSRDGRVRELSDGSKEPPSDLAWFATLDEALAVLTDSRLADAKVIIEMLDGRNESANLSIDVTAIAVAGLAIVAGASERPTIVAEDGEVPVLSISEFGAARANPFVFTLSGCLLLGDFQYTLTQSEGSVLFERSAVLDGSARCIAPVGGLLDIDLRVRLHSSMLDGLLVIGPARVTAADSLSATRGSSVSPSCPSSKGPTAKAAASPPIDGDDLPFFFGPISSRSIAELCLERCTVLGSVSARIVDATDCVLHSLMNSAPENEEDPSAFFTLDVFDGQGSCIRYSRIPEVDDRSSGLRTFEVTCHPPKLIERRLACPDAAPSLSAAPTASCAGW